MSGEAPARGPVVAVASATPTASGPASPGTAGRSATGGPIGSPTADRGRTATRRPTSVVEKPSSRPSARPSVRYTFPVQPAERASFGSSHHDYPATDVFARCGEAFVAPTSGVVLEVSRVDRWQPDIDDGATRGGLSVTLRGDDGVRYYGSHLGAIAAEARPGSRVGAGARLGLVGRSGSARFVACHLHFGLSPPCPVPGDWWTRRGVVSPWPYLTSWRRGGQLPPAGEVARWRQANGCPRAPDPGD